MRLITGDRFDDKNAAIEGGGAGYARAFGDACGSRTRHRRRNLVEKGTLIMAHHRRVVAAAAEQPALLSARG